MDRESATLLVVDDAAVNREMLRKRLGKLGYRVLVAEDGKGALEQLGREGVDLLILDIMMPGMSGLEVLGRLRKRPELEDLPVIIASALSESDDMVSALEAGASDYVTKPFDFPVLLARIKSQLRSRRRRMPVSTGGELGTGSVLEGRYRLDSVIGIGSFGAVYRGTHVGLDNPVAVKVLQTHRGNTPEARERFRQEGISTCRIKHPNAVSVLDFGVTEQGVAYLVMELLVGRSLEQELRRDGKLPLRRCVEVVVPVCEVLAQAHARGVLHRDIKPANIFLHRGTKGEIVKVLDFGIAKLADEAVSGDLTMDGAVLGTPAYMAPERFSKRPYDGRTDVYSLGVTLYQMLSGRQPFEADGADMVSVIRMQIEEEPAALAELCPELPRAVVELVHRCLEKLAENRPDARELAHHLAEAVGMELDWPAVAESLKRDLEEVDLESPRRSTRSSTWVSVEEEEATESMLLATPHEEKDEVSRDTRVSRESVTFDLDLDDDEVSSLLDSLEETDVDGEDR